MSDLQSDLENIRARIAALPERLRVEGEDDEPTPTDPTKDGPLAIIARQGRLILRLTAASEATDARLKSLSESYEAVNAHLQAARDATERAEEETRRVLREALIPLMDSIDFSALAAAKRGDAKLAEAIAGARRDGLRRLATVGVSEIPAEPGTMFDGRLHEAVEARPAPPENPVPRYAILSVVRPGFQRGTEVLRRTTVITAE